MRTANSDTSGAPSSVPPPTLYHYTSAAGLLGIVQSRELWATNIHFLNDRREFAHALEVAKEGIGERVTQEPDAHAVRFAARLEEIVGQIKELNACVFSLSGESDMLSQWRAYCPRAGGYALGFDSRRLSQLAGNQSFLLVKCVYEREEQRALIREAVSEAFDALSEWSINTDEAPAKVIEKAALVFRFAMYSIAPRLKHPAFTDEREWRLVASPVSFDNPHWSAHAGRATIIPHLSIELGKPEAFPLTEIVLGPTADTAFSRHATDMFLTSQRVRFGRIIASDAPFRET